MKLLFTLLTLGLSSLVNAQPPLLISGPGISVDKESHDFGEISQTPSGEYTFCDFVVTNTGNEPLIISKCSAPCGCTVPNCNKKPILPGESTVVKVKYDSHRIGTFNKSVTIRSNAENTPEKRIRIKGTVVAIEN